jgi:hypothetical protein
MIESVLNVRFSGTVVRVTVEEEECDRWDIVRCSELVEAEREPEESEPERDVAGDAERERENCGGTQPGGDMARQRRGDERAVRVCLSLFCG